MTKDLYAGCKASYSIPLASFKGTPSGLLTLSASVIALFAPSCVCRPETAGPGGMAGSVLKV